MALDHKRGKEIVHRKFRLADVLAVLFGFAQ